MVARSHFPSSIADGQDLIVLVGESSGKRWWRHFRNPQPVRVWWHGAWRSTFGRVAAPDSPEHRTGFKRYRERHPRATSGVDTQLVLIAEPGTAPPSSPIAASVQPTDRALWRAWTGWVTLGEFAGFSVPAAVGAATATMAAGLSAPILVAAGAVEGALLGLAQAHVLRTALPEVNHARWVGATAVGAAIAWMVGLTPMLTDGRLFDLPTAALISLALVLGVVLLGSIGTAQWLVLRRRVEHSSWWILTTAASWTVGLIVFTGATTPFWQEGQSVLLITAIGVVGGLLMAATVAVLTGWAMLKLRRHQPRRD